MSRFWVASRTTLHRISPAYLPEREGQITSHWGTPIPIQPTKQLAISEACARLEGGQRAGCAFCPRAAAEAGGWLVGLVGWVGCFDQFGSLDCLTVVPPPGYVPQGNPPRYPQGFPADTLGDPQGSPWRDPARDPPGGHPADTPVDTTGASIGLCSVWASVLRAIWGVLYSGAAFGRPNQFQVIFI